MYQSLIFATILNGLANVNSNVLSTCQCGAAANALNTRIVHGTETAPHAYPWVVGLMFHDDRVSCGGSIISSRHILTAAHCTRPSDPLLYTVAVGMHNLQQPYSKHTVKGASTHPKFVEKEDYDIYDIAVLELNEEINLQQDTAVNVCLPSSELHLNQMKGIIVGWGRISENGESSKVLLEGKVDVLTDDGCKKSPIANYFHEEAMMCALNVRQDACQGDSGGSIFVETDLNRFEQIGVTSFGVKCGTEVPGVYARIDAALQWLSGIIATANVCYDKQMSSPDYPNRFRKLLLTNGE